MHQLPLFLVSAEELAPLPSGIHVLDVPTESTHLFNSAEINKVEYVVLGIVEDADPFEVMEDFDREGDGQLKRIGVLCVVKERETCDDLEFTAITLECMSRCFVRKIHIGRTVDDPHTVWVEHEPVPEIFQEDEEGLENDIKRVVTPLLKKQSLWQTGDNRAAKMLKTTSDTLARVSILGDAILKKESRLRFLQALDNYDRWAILTTEIRRLASAKMTPKSKSKSQPRSTAYKPAKTNKIPSWRDRVEQSPMPPAVKEKVLEEVTRLDNLPSNSSEHAQVLDYLKWVLSLPWGTESYLPTDLKTLHTTLDETHYGLDDVKEHMLEIMCAQELKEGTDGTVLCFVGPPGVGKTTIAKAIAQVSNRPLIQIALGGIGDTAELRGHRRTYIGARPGRIITELRDCKTMDPLILLDEIDKLAAYKGDPSSALLEILDPEQNDKFVDHYLEIPVDLSKVMFICTANEESSIPAPLLDRMEIIRFRSYHPEERKVITDEFLLPKLQKSYNTHKMDIRFEEEALTELHKVPNVRAIEKVLAKALRRGMTKIHVHGEDSYTVTPKDIKDIKKNYTPTARKRVGFK